MVLNLNILNSQSGVIAPGLLLEPTKDKALDEIKRFQYIGRLENLSQMIQKITYSSNDFSPFHSNLTTSKYYLLDDLQGSLKDFVYDKMKADFLLYEAVQEHFG